MKITKRQLRRIIREESHAYGKDYLSRAHSGDEDELADPELDYGKDDEQEFEYATDLKRAESEKNHRDARNAYRPAMRPTVEGKFRMTKRELRKLIEEARTTLHEDRIDTELDNLKKNITNDLDHISDLKDDIHDDHEEELKAEKEKRDEAEKKDESINRVLRLVSRRLSKLRK